jgi:hypothetical protein
VVWSLHCLKRPSLGAEAKLARKQGWFPWVVGAPPIQASHCGIETHPIAGHHGPKEDRSLFECTSYRRRFAEEIDSDRTLGSLTRHQPPIEMDSWERVFWEVRSMVVEFGGSVASGDDALYEGHHLASVSLEDWTCLVVIPWISGASTSCFLISLRLLHSEAFKTPQCVP